MASAMVLGAETPMGRLRPIGFDWMLRQEQKSPEQALERLQAVTLQDVNIVLSQRAFELATIVGTGPIDRLD